MYTAVNFVEDVAYAIAESVTNAIIHIVENREKHTVIDVDDVIEIIC